MDVLNKELQNRLNELTSTNKELLEKLLIDIENISYRAEVTANLRNRIREYVALEMKK